MKGLLYKEFFLLRSGLIFMVVFQAILSGICISLPLIGLDTKMIVILTAISYYLSFLILALVNQELFAHDENRPWGNFVSSTPQTAAGQVAGKYYMILIVNFILLFCCYLTDVIVVCVADDVTISAIIVGMLIFCLRILIYAIEIPFVIRLGSGVGIAVKGVLLALFALILLCYGLFGDISFLFRDDPVAALHEFVTTGNVMWIAALIPYAAAGAYYLSYRISVKLYKEADYSE
ncbi:MAG: ABC-2 transporter permease [Lachnospiraceae bacterium]|nr:ABC-2 transporter permease [Lachnospiraceae bacterium]